MCEGVEGRGGYRVVGACGGKRRVQGCGCMCEGTGQRGMNGMC